MRRGVQWCKKKYYELFGNHAPVILTQLKQRKSDYRGILEPDCIWIGFNGLYTEARLSMVFRSGKGQKFRRQ